MADTPPNRRGSRRDFITFLGAGTSAAWLASIWPGALADAATASDGAAAGQSPQFRALTAQQAADFGAIADRVIPRDDAPGARDVGVVFFADHLLSSFAPNKKPAFDNALAEVNAAARKRYPSAASFAALTAKQQDETLESIDTTDAFNVLRTVTVSGYFSHPSHRGNRNLAGWKAIGFEERMAWTPPFGYYDRPEIMARLVPRKRA